MSLTTNQKNSLDQVRLHVSSDTLKVFQNVFSMDVSNADSSIEIITAQDNDNLRKLENDMLYCISSNLLGDVEGRMQVLLRETDFKSLGWLMKPVLDMFSGATPVIDAEERHAEGDGSAPGSFGIGFQEQMMEMLAELGNNLCGVYSRSLYTVCAFSSHHSLPVVVTLGIQQRAIQEMLAQMEASGQSLILVSNSILVLGKTIRFWYLFLPTEASYASILRRLENRKALGATQTGVARYRDTAP